LGVLLYTLLQGYPPFSPEPWTCKRFERLFELRKSASDAPNLDWFFPSKSFSPKTRLLVHSLLAWCPEERLRVTDIKQTFPWLFDGTTENTKAMPRTSVVVDKENVRNEAVMGVVASEANLNQQSLGDISALNRFMQYLGLEK